MNKQIPTTIGILIIVLLAGGVVGATFFLYSEMEEDIVAEEPVVDEEEKNESVEKNNRNETTTEHLSEKTIYRNTQYGFEITYPRNFERTHRDPSHFCSEEAKETECFSSIFIFFDSREENKPQSGEEDHPRHQKAGLHISIYENPEKLSGQEWVDVYNLKEENSTCNLEVIKIGEEDAVSIACYQGAGFIRNYVNKGNYMFRVSSTTLHAHGPDREPQREFYEELLSTFRFLD